MARLPTTRSGAAGARGDALLEEAAFRCSTVQHNVQREVWIAVFEKTLFDKVYVITGGGGWMSLDGARYALEPGRVFLFPAGTIQRGSPDGARGGLRVLWTHFEAFTAGTLQILRLLDVPACLVGDSAAAIRALMEEMHAEYRAKRPGWPLAVKSLLPRILLTACRAPRRDVQPPDERGEERACATGTPPHQIDTVSRAVERITRELGAGLTLGSLAHEAHLSAPYFNQLFRRLVGMPPMRFLERCRIRRAQELLVATRHGIATVGATVGYADPAHFTRAFRRVAGAAPTAWRAAAAHTASVR